MQNASGSSSTVFIVRCGDYLKIGYANGFVGVKVLSLARECPYEYTLLAELPGGRALESKLRFLFEEWNHRGSWFRLEGAVREFAEVVKAKKFMRVRKSPIPGKQPRSAWVSLRAAIDAA